MPATIGQGPVYAIEPTEEMRRIAVAKELRTDVHHIAGRAETIPLVARSCDAVVMFFVAHHITDIVAAAQAISDVLRPGGRLLVAGSFSERQHPRAYYQYFPRTRDIERQFYPTSGAYKQAFSRVGLTALVIDEVEHEVSPSLAAYSQRLARRAISTFEHISDQEIADGMGRLNNDAAAETMPRPIRNTHDLLIFKKQ
jgi:ubiquinone/menaquinone biosynthesis C-methylase UbiE